MNIQLPIKSRWGAKDQEKANAATKFIGRGSPKSSTAAYARAVRERANCGNYTADDRVFVSVEGRRAGRVPLDKAEVLRAVNAKAVFIADTPYHRRRAYNEGERELAALLSAEHYEEWPCGDSEFSYWVPQGFAGLL